MLIYDEKSRAIIIDDITTPILSEYYWVLDLSIRDYTLAPLQMLEEIVAPTLTVKIRGFEFNLPANWCMLVYAQDTSQLDIIEIGELAGKDFTALVYGPNMATVAPGHVRVVDYDSEGYNYAPSLGKNQMLCHPIGPEEWVNVAQSDVYNKYLRDCTIGDII